MKEVAVLKLDLHDDKVMQKAMKTVAGFHGVDSVAMDMKDKKLKVTGDADPVNIVNELRKKICPTKLESFVPAKEPEKKKEEHKKDDQKKPQEQKKDGKDNVADLVRKLPELKINELRKALENY